MRPHSPLRWKQLGTSGIWYRHDARPGVDRPVMSYRRSCFCRYTNNLGHYRLIFETSMRVLGMDPDSWQEFWDHVV